VRNKNKERSMTDHTPFFDLIGRDMSALLGIAEYLDVCGRNRVANLVRTVTFSIERTVNDFGHDFGHDLLHRRRRNKPKGLGRGDRERGRSTPLVRRGHGSGVTAKRKVSHRPKPTRSASISARSSPRVVT
jgi:hypothetical protein